MSETPPEPQQDTGNDPDPQPQPPKNRSLEDMLGALDEEARSAVLGQLQKARKEAADYRSKLRDAEPLVKKAKDLEAANQTAQEKAEAAARDAEARAAAALHRVASAEVRAALTGIVPDPSAVVEDLNIARFIGDDGEVDGDAVKALAEKYSALTPPPGPRAPAPNPAQGNGAKPLTLAEQIAAVNLQAATPGERRQAVSRSLNLKARQLTQLRNQQG